MLYSCVSDAENPMFTSCPGGQTVGTDYRLATATLNWTVTVTDNSMVTLTSDYNTSYVFPLGPTMVTYNATDDSGNTAQCVFTITVEGRRKPHPCGTLSNIFLTNIMYSYM